VGYRIVVGKKYKKLIGKTIPEEHIKRIQDEYADIIANPTRETKPLKGGLGQYFRYRRITDTIPQYRILFAVYDCGFEVDSEPAYCKEDYCEVGQEIQEDITEWIDPDQAEKEAKQNALLPVPPPQIDPCNGVVRFAVFGTREFMENFYNLPLKKQMQLI
jgi:mRNA-degrading endonuclease RelE of RelBE toxin-antitoxin system